MLCTILVPDILMINAPIFKHSGGFGEEEFQTEKMMKEIYPTRNITIYNQNFTLSGIISHVNGTSLESGHFVADIISGDKIFHCDDDRVTRSEHLSGFGYVFTYSRSDHVDSTENIQIAGENDDIRCESCNEPFKMTSILRHVTNSKCKTKVSADFVNRMKEISANRRKKKKAKLYHDNKDFYQDYFRNRHEEHKTEDNLRDRKRHQKHKMEDNLKNLERHQDNKMEDNLRDRERHQKHKMEDNLKDKERHQKHKMEDNLKDRERHQRHRMEDNLKDSKRHQDHKMEDNLKDRERHQKHKMEHNLKCKERYRDCKEIIHYSADVATRFKMFKEETMEGKKVNSYLYHHLFHFSCICRSNLCLP